MGKTRRAIDRNSGIKEKVVVDRSHLKGTMIEP